MDDIFSILIYIIVIISFLSSIFKKKKQEAPPQQRTRLPQDRIPVRTTRADVPQENSAEYDILREIEAMFKTDATQESEISRKTRKIEEAHRSSEMRPASDRISYEDYVSAQEHAPEYSVPEPVLTETEATPSEHKYAEARRRPTRLERKVEEDARKFELMLEEKKAYEETFIFQLREKMKDPETFREYILAAEILGKPKALRRSNIMRR